MTTELSIRLKLFLLGYYSLGVGFIPTTAKYSISTVLLMRCIPAKKEEFDFCWPEGRGKVEQKRPNPNEFYELHFKKKIQ